MGSREAQEMKAKVACLMKLSGQLLSSKCSHRNVEKHAELLRTALRGAVSEKPHVVVVGRSKVGKKMLRIMIKDCMKGKHTISKMNVAKINRPVECIVEADCLVYVISAKASGLTMEEMKFLGLLEGSLVGHSMVVFTLSDDEEAGQSAIAKLEQGIRKYLPHAETFVLGDPRRLSFERCQALQKTFNAGYAQIASEWTRQLERRRLRRVRDHLGRLRESLDSLIDRSTPEYAEKQDRLREFREVWRSAEGGFRRDIEDALVRRIPAIIRSDESLMKTDSVWQVERYFRQALWSEIMIMVRKHDRLRKSPPIELHISRLEDTLHPQVRMLLHAPPNALWTPIVLVCTLVTLAHGFWNRTFLEDYLGLPTDSTAYLVLIITFIQLFYNLLMLYRGWNRKTVDIFFAAVEAARKLYIDMLINRVKIALEASIRRQGCKDQKSSDWDPETWLDLLAEVDL